MISYNQQQNALGNKLQAIEARVDELEKSMSAAGHQSVHEALQDAHETCRISPPASPPSGLGPSPLALALRRVTLLLVLRLAIRLCSVATGAGAGVGVLDGGEHVLCAHMPHGLHVRQQLASDQLEDLYAKGNAVGSFAKATRQCESESRNSKAIRCTPSRVVPRAV